MCDENEEIPVTSDRVKTMIAMLTIISCMIPSELIKLVSLRIVSLDDVSYLL